MQDILNASIITIAIAFLGLMVMDFVAGLIVLATPTQSPMPPVPPRKLTLSEIMDRPDIVPTPEQQQELDQLEDLFAPTPKTHALGQLLLEEYDRENQQYWAIWHQTYQSVRANLQYFPKIEEATAFEELTTPNSPKIDTVNEATAPKRHRGRPKKVQTEVQTEVQTAPKKRGQKRKAA